MRRIWGVLVVMALLLGSSVAGARTSDCTALVPAAERDNAAEMLAVLMGAAIMQGDYMIDLGTLQETQRIIAALEAAPTIGCGAVVQ